jgi:hypothetical protein
MRVLAAPLLLVASSLSAADAPPSYTFTTLAGIAGGQSYADGGIGEALVEIYEVF